MSIYAYIKFRSVVSSIHTINLMLKLNVQRTFTVEKNLGRIVYICI